MTPQDLDGYLTVLRAHKVTDAAFELGSDKFRVVFAQELPELPMPAGEPSEPGAWKHWAKGDQ